MVAFTQSIVLQDAYHGPITLHGDALRVFESFEVQRMSRIAQCGVVNVAFPAMTHTRLAHSLGTARVSQLLLDALQHNDPALTVSREQAEDIFIGALCHDLGHGPYSHLWDELFAYELQHEARSVLLFAKIARERLPHFSPERVARIQRIIHPVHSFEADDADTWQYDIVCNVRTGVDVDKFDYLVRDLHLSGVQYPFALQPLLTSARVVNHHLEYAQDLVANLRGARAVLHAHVYSHPLVTAFQLTLADLLREHAARYVGCTNTASAVCSSAFLNLDDATVVAAAPESETKEAVRARQGFHFWGSVALNLLTPALRLAEEVRIPVRTVLRADFVEFYSCVALSPQQLRRFQNLNF